MPSKIHGKNAKFYIDKIDLSGDGNSVTIDAGIDVAEVTSFGDAYKEFLEGAAGFTVSLDAFFNADSGELDERTQAMIALGAKQIGIYSEGSAVGKWGYEGEGILTAKPLVTPIGGAATLGLTAQGHGLLSRSYILENAAKTGVGAVEGAVADDGASLTDETANANSAATDDMTLLPAEPAVGDAYDFGFAVPANRLRLKIHTPGEGTWTIVWKYWDGSAWSNLSGVTDGTEAFKAAAGDHDVVFTQPVDWAESTIETITSYWIRAEVTAYTDISVQPKGSQAWVDVQGTAKDYGAAGSDKVSAVLRVLAVTGSGTIDVKILGSSDNGVADPWADVSGLAFTQLTAVGCERKQSAAAGERYLRVAWLITGFTSVTLFCSIENK